MNGPQQVHRPDAGIDEVFVYGTLKPGDVRWPLVERYVIDQVRDATSGRLFDTGMGYPAARFGSEGTITGWRLRLTPATLGAALAELDEIEGAVWGLYRRVAVTTASGEVAWAYEFGADPVGLTDLRGTWPEAGHEEQR